MIYKNTHCCRARCLSRRPRRVHRKWRPPGHYTAANQFISFRLSRFLNLNTGITPGPRRSYGVRTQTYGTCTGKCNIHRRRLSLLLPLRRRSMYPNRFTTAFVN
jgi:hypothetical protein